MSLDDSASRQLSRPAAHRALFISEIAYRIASILHEDPFPVIPQLVAFALTCKALYDPAMDVEWGDVSLLRLLACFPMDDVVRKVPFDEDDEDAGHTFKFLRTPDKPEDWDRFMHYSRRVRVLYCPQEDPSIMDAISACRPIPAAFPNMTSLTVEGNIDDPPHPFFLVGPKVESCDLWYSRSSDGAFLEHIVRTCPKLKALSVLDQSPRSDRPAVRDIGSLLRTALNLTSLSLNSPLSATAIRSIGILSQLRTLQINFETNGDLTELDGNSGFRGLQDVSIRDVSRNSMTILGPFVRYIQGAPLRSVCYYLRTVSSESPVIIRDFFAALETQKSLEEVAVYAQLHINASALATVDMVLLRPLAQLKQLRKLRISGPGVRLSHSDVRRLGAQWPRLSHLMLQPIGRIADTQLIDITLLPCFARHFPHLTHLCLPFNAEVSLPEPQTTSEFRSYALQELVIPNCPIANEPERVADVAMYISEHFPRATLDISRVHKRGVAGRFSNWKLVKHLLTLFARAEKRTNQTSSRPVGQN